MEKRTKKISIRVSDSEYDILVKKVKEIDRPLSYLIRNSTLAKQIISKCDVNTVLQLKKIGTNLNQISKWMNTKRRFIEDNSGEIITISDVISKVNSLINLIYDREIK